MVTYVGTLGSDIYTGTDAVMYGLDGNDNLSATAGSHTLYGGEGTDRLNFQDGTNSYGDMYGGSGDDNLDADESSFAGTDDMYGDEGNDVIYAYAGADRLDGGQGNDLLYAGAGIDYLYGGDGGDTLDGGADADSLYGGRGNDTLLGGTGADLMIGGEGEDTYEVDNVGDRVFEFAGQGIADKVFAYVDFALPDAVDNLIMGGNAVYGTGSSTDNIIIGNAQNNVLQGGAGYDTLTGGAGSDLFVVRPGFGVDVITDFVAGAGTPDAVVFSTALFQSFAQVYANSAQVGADTWIGDGYGNTVVLQNVNRAALHANDFGFV
ncbi:calcium-binding protein [Bosea caraganae]|uniref:Calcium-binding protein n=1 Tax=Bosea caraganae TaxID=2763117 RepID=A0A370L829_9HYPH|nr:calcium-binding protein [Bosea caraganae]RDJ25203.1 calcium-binding protein [Bosea caraganae]RDJ26313.1 calcium-binding protein [Bosea caraganae]